MISIKKLLNSFKYAFRGIKFVFLEEQNMKIHVLISVVVIVTGLIMKLSCMEWIAVVICIGMVFTAEIFNTAIENIVDFISPNVHPLAGKIKDISAAAVIICAVVSVVVGSFIFLPKFF